MLAGVMARRRLHSELAPGFSEMGCPGCQSKIIWAVGQNPSCTLCGWWADHDEFSRTVSPSDFTPRFAEAKDRKAFKDAERRREFFRKILRPA